MLTRNGQDVVEGTGRIEGEDRDGQVGDALKEGRDLRQDNAVTALRDQQSVGNFHRPNGRNQGFGAGRKQVENALGELACFVLKAPGDGHGRIEHEAFSSGGLHRLARVWKVSREWPRVAAGGWRRLKRDRLLSGQSRAAKAW